MFANGGIEAHGPDAHTYAALERLAGLLGAEVADEEQERLPPRPGTVAPVRQFALFWPVPCLILLGLLVWRCAT